MLYLQKTEFDAAPLATDPFPHVIVRHFIAPDAIARIGADFPSLPGPGAFPPAALKLHGHFAGLIEELAGSWLRDAVAQKFAIDLDGRPLVWTVRGYLRERDGGVHTDSESKLVTLLLYLNEDWQDAGGRLRLLRSPDSLMTPVVEVPPLGGTLLCFARSDRSWHGHLPRRASELLSNAPIRCP